MLEADEPHPRALMQVFDAIDHARGTG